MVQKAEEVGLLRVDPDTPSVTDAARSWACTQESRDGQPLIDESEPLPEGSHVRLLKDGRQMGSGVIDVCMPDGSACWIWLDDGAGRRLVHQSDPVQIVISPPVPEKAASTVSAASWSGS
jgi:hypothetical protein